MQRPSSASLYRSPSHSPANSPQMEHTRTALRRRPSLLMLDTQSAQQRAIGEILRQTAAGEWVSDVEPASEPLSCRSVPIRPRSGSILNTGVGSVAGGAGTVTPPVTPSPNTPIRGRFDLPSSGLSPVQFSAEIQRQLSRSNSSPAMLRRPSSAPRLHRPSTPGKYERPDFSQSVPRGALSSPGPIYTPDDSTIRPRVCVPSLDRQVPRESVAKGYETRFGPLGAYHKRTDVIYDPMYTQVEKRVTSPVFHKPKSAVRTCVFPL